MDSCPPLTFRLWYNPICAKRDVKLQLTNWLDEYAVIHWTAVDGKHDMAQEQYRVWDVMVMHRVVQNQLRQQQKVFSQVRVVQTQRLKSLRDLYDQHLKASRISCPSLLLTAWPWILLLLLLLISYSFFSIRRHYVSGLSRLSVCPAVSYTHLTLPTIYSV